MWRGAHLCCSILPCLAFLGPGTGGVFSVPGISHSTKNFSVLPGMTSSCHGPTRRSMRSAGTRFSSATWNGSAQPPGLDGSEPVLRICSATFPWVRLSPSGHLAWTCLLCPCLRPLLVVIGVQRGSQVLDQWKRGPGLISQPPRLVSATKLLPTDFWFIILELEDSLGPQPSYTHIRTIPINPFIMQRFQLQGSAKNKRKPKRSPFVWLTSLPLVQRRPWPPTLASAGPGSGLQELKCKGKKKQRRVRSFWL